MTPGRTACRWALATCAAVTVAGVASACAKKSAELSAASPAAAATTAKAEGAAAGATVDGQDNTAPPGIDLTALDEFERKVFFRVVNKESAACGKAESLIKSVKTDRGCRKSHYAVKYVARLVDQGFTDSEIAEHLGKRFRAGPPKRIDVSEAPSKGSPSARITLIEFVDYECPHCKRVQPVMRQVLDEFKDEAKLYFKHYPLGSHTNARLAAEAAVAANKQGQFWPYNEKIWANADTLTPALLEQFAKDLKMDVEKWRKDLASDEVKNRVQKDRSDGTALGLQATPTIYLNGREFTDGRDIDSLRDWINEELGK